MQFKMQYQNVHCIPIGDHKNILYENVNYSFNSIILMGSFGLYGQSETMNTENTHY